MCAYILLFSLLYKKSLPIVTELHVQVDWLSIYFNVNLQESKKIIQLTVNFINSITNNCLEQFYSLEVIGLKRSPL